MSNILQQYDLKKYARFNKFFHSIGGILTICAIAFLAYRLWQQASELHTIPFTPSTILTMLVAIFFYITTIGVSSYVLKLLLKTESVLISFFCAWLIFGVAQIGKYLPGNVFHYLFQAMIGQKLGVSSKKLAVSMGIHIVILGSSTGMLSVIGVATDERLFNWVAQQFPAVNRYSGVLLMGGVVIIAGFWVILIFHKQIQNICQHVIKPRLPEVMLSIFLYLLVFLGYGILHLLIIERIFYVHTHLSWYQLTFGFSLAWTIGFITPGAPGGLGVREAIFLILFESTLNSTLAIELALLVRIFTCLGDAIVFVGSYIALQYHISKHTTR